MTKRKKKAVRAASKHVSIAAPRKPTARRKRASWQGALERNLRAEGYSAREARELVELAAS
jgi:hypothetical protein